MTTSFLRVLVCALPLLLTAQAQAQHSDVEFGYLDGKIEIGFGAEGRIFEADIPLDGLTPRFTTNPGFAADEPAEGFILNPSDIIGYNIHDRLFYWDGISEVASDPAWTIQIDDVVGNFIVSNTSAESFSSFAPNSQIIGQAGPTGEFHTHLDFTLSGTAPTGAYGLLMSLSTNAAGIANSQTFGIMFNFGLDDAAFEAGVDHFVTTRGLSVVPEPGAAALLLTGLGSVLLRRQRRTPTNSNVS